MVLGIESASRSRLSAVLRNSGDVFSPQDVANVLGVSTLVASRYLGRWTTQGWLFRIMRGLYSSVPLTAKSSNDVALDPWVIAASVFAPCYIGGWSAAEHWGLTEQLFRTTIVITTKASRNSRVSFLANNFKVRLAKQRWMFGTKTVWRGKTKVMVSDPAKTVIDMMAAPSLGGGAKTVEEMLGAYLKTDGASVGQLSEYADKMGEGVVLKRLGFYLDRAGLSDNEMVRTMQKRLTPGTAMLDSSLPSEKLVTRWRLWVPSNWKGAAGD